jgi:hypothetical protein
LGLVRHKDKIGLYCRTHSVPPITTLHIVIKIFGRYLHTCCIRNTLTILINIMKLTCNKKEIVHLKLHLSAYKWLLQDRSICSIHMRALYNGRFLVVSVVLHISSLRCYVSVSCVVSVWIANYCLPHKFSLKYMYHSKLIIGSCTSQR